MITKTFYSCQQKLTYTKPFLSAQTGMLINEKVSGVIKCPYHTSFMKEIVMVKCSVPVWRYTVHSHKSSITAPNLYLSSATPLCAVSIATGIGPYPGISSVSRCLSWSAAVHIVSDSPYDEQIKLSFLDISCLGRQHTLAAFCPLSPPCFPLMSQRFC